MIATVKYWAAGVAVAVVVSVSGAGAQSWPCGVSGSNLTCTKVGGTVTVSGTGAMKDYGASLIGPAPDIEAPWGTVDTVEIENGVTYIGQNAFVFGIKVVKVNATNPPTVGRNGFVYDKANKILYVLQSKIADYRAADVWKDFGYINPSTVTFDARNGSDTTMKLVSYGDTVARPNDPVRDDFIFDYWFMLPSAGLTPPAYNFSTAITSDIVLAAVWKTPTSVLGRNTPNTANIAVRQTGRELKISTPNRAAARYGVELYSVSGKRQRVSPVYHTDGAITVVLPHIAAGSYILRVGDGKSGMERRVLVR